MTTPLRETRMHQETQMRRGTHVALTAALLLALALSLFMQLWALPTEIERVITTFPETAPLAVPSVVWEVVAIGCWQVTILIGLRLVMLARRNRLNASAYGWLRAIVGFLLAFFALVVTAFVALNVMGYTTPGVIYGLIGAGLIALIASGSLAVFLSTRK
jgi:hypothetical protein